MWQKYFVVQMCHILFMQQSSSFLVTSAQSHGSELQNRTNKSRIYHLKCTTMHKESSQSVGFLKNKVFTGYYLECGIYT